MATRRPPERARDHDELSAFAAAGSPAAAATDTRKRRSWAPSRRYVSAPDGVQWRVRRRWAPSIRLRWPGRPIDGSSALNRIGAPDLDPESLVISIIALVLIIFVVIPLLLFGLELVIAGCVVAGGVIGKLLFRRPWQIQATTSAHSTAPRALEWEVSGWRESRALIRRVSADIEAGRNPQPTAVRFDSDPGTPA
jgi:hypothetical protein